ncbi:MAG: hypothetical protein O2855_02000 [Planctomycetota bacterium]|nr:hypothetical protein [Planctomycetota bacterium]
MDAFRHMFLVTAATLLVAGAGAIVSASSTDDDAPKLQKFDPPVGYPAEFSLFMMLEFGPMWSHTMQEEIIFRWYCHWCNRMGYDKPVG